MKIIDMKVAVIGVGYVGLVHSLLMANTKCVDEVICIDVDTNKINGLKKGVSPIYEDGIDEKLTAAIAANKLRFTSELAEMNEADAIFICVGTPEGADGHADLSYIVSVAMSVAMNAKDNAVVVIKSTVPVGTNAGIAKIIQDIREEKCDERKFHMASNPEFLREGRAIQDAFHPDRIVIGVEDRFADDVLSEIYNSNETRLIRTSIPSAEMVKYASNAMLATRISFMNEIANLCEAVGADFDDVKKCVGMDNRIGSAFLNAGCGYGGSCFPKDVKALIKTAEDNHTNMRVLIAVDKTNETQKTILYNKYYEFFNDESAKMACVLGLAFKPGTDDMREAPSIVLLRDLVDECDSVVACDPVACENAKKIFGDEIEYETDPYKAVEGADVVFLVTEWDEFKKLDLKKVKELMRGDVFIDGRGIFKRKDMEKLGFKFDRIG